MKAKLSDAIREVAKTMPQCFDRMMEYAEPGSKLVLSCCALGAAYLSAYVPDWNNYPNVANCLANKWPIFDHSDDIMSRIMEMNDEYHLTREQIADWLDDNYTEEQLTMRENL